MEQKQQQFSIGYFILAFIILLMMQDYLASPHVQTVTYSQFKSLAKKGFVTEVAVQERMIHGTIKAEGIKQVFSEEQLKQIGHDGKQALAFAAVRA